MSLLAAAAGCIYVLAAADLLNLTTAAILDHSLTMLELVLLTGWWSISFSLNINNISNVGSP